MGNPWDGRTCQEKSFSDVPKGKEEEESKRRGDPKGKEEDEVAVIIMVAKNAR